MCLRLQRRRAVNGVAGVSRNQVLPWTEYRTRDPTHADMRALKDRHFTVGIQCHAIMTLIKVGYRLADLWFAPE